MLTLDASEEVASDIFICYCYGISQYSTLFCRLAATAAAVLCQELLYQMSTRKLSFKAVLADVVIFRVQWAFSKFMLSLAWPLVQRVAVCSTTTIRVLRMVLLERLYLAAAAASFILWHAKNRTSKTRTKEGCNSSRANPTKAAALFQNNHVVGRYRLILHAYLVY